MSVPTNGRIHIIIIHGYTHTLTQHIPSLLPEGALPYKQHSVNYTISIRAWRENRVDPSLLWKMNLVVTKFHPPSTELFLVRMRGGARAGDHVSLAVHVNLAHAHTRLADACLASSSKSYRIIIYNYKQSRQRMC